MAFGILQHQRGLPRVAEQQSRATQRPSTPCAIGMRPKCPMSAYSASAPVMVSTTVPSVRKARSGSSAMEGEGESRATAPNTSGTGDDVHPQPPITKNQTSITGPKKRPTTPVPRYWIANNPNVITTVTGSTATANSGRRASDPRPPTARKSPA